jgi:hypothetical protein
MKKESSIAQNTESNQLPLWQSTLISQILDSIEKNYIFPEKFSKNTLKIQLTSQFTQHFLEPEYTDENGPFCKKQFANTLSSMLQTLTGDPHFVLQFSPDLIAENSDCLQQELKFPWALSPEDPRYMPANIREQHSEDLKRRGCGFYDRETLKEHLHVPLLEQNLNIPSEVGYIGLQFIADPKMHNVVAEKTYRIMCNMLNKKAIIIDLRGNTGGSSEGPRHFLSFFFKKLVHVNTLKTRVAGKWKVEEYWTYNIDQLNPGNLFKGCPIPDLSEKPIYVLINNETFSAGEELAYDLEQLGRATIIGMPTKGGAHAFQFQPLFSLMDREIDGEQVIFNKNFMIGVPNSTSINPISGTNWEDGPYKGVQPQIRSEQALETALSEINKHYMRHQDTNTSSPSQNKYPQFGGLFCQSSQQDATENDRKADTFEPGSNSHT